MSTWNIYHKDGSKLTDVNGEQITVHGLEYSDSWMGECFVTINFKHEVPINFQIGDYIVYRGERFELNYEPGKDKQARPDTYGEGFVYDSVKFNALQDELARAEFLDVVLNDNELHYTALPKFPFYVQTLDDLLDRIQACLNEQIGAGLWKIYSRNKERSVQRGALESEWLSVYGEKTDDNVIESMSITVDSQTCWQALALVNEKWDINFIVRGRNIYVGTTGIQANHIFKYGIGNGLYEIVQNADSDQSVVTRLRAYGSEKNLPSHYYADLGVKYVANITKVVGASTNVTLELDLDYIETYFKNPRKYIVSGETGEQSFGWVLKVTFDFKTEITGYVTQTYDSKKCRFYSELKGTQTDTGDEESKEKLDAFIAQVKAGNTKMYITSGLNKKAVPSSMKEYAKNLPNNMSINRLMLPGFPHVSLSDFYNSLTNEEKRYVNPTGRQHRFSTDPHRPYIDSINIEQIGLRSASQFFDTDDKTNGVIEIYPTIEEMEIGGVRVDEIDKGVAPDDDGRFGDNETVKNVDIYLKKAIDFDINDLKDDDFSISMKDGMCGGRTFKVASSTKIDGRWRLTIERVKDDALELWFPYKDYPIKKGDHFVLTGITLPDSYVNAASLKLLKYAIAFIDKNDYTRYVYQPKVDEIFMARQHDLAEKDTTGVIKSLHDTLKAGDLMEFEDTDLRIGGVISIDQLTIKEEDGKIPTYDITLREDKEVGTIQKIQQQISSLQSGNGGTGAGLTTTQVKSQVATEGSKHFISKINDDTAKGTITWEKVQKFLQGLLVGGGSWTPDAEGRSHLITDYLEVRMKAIFEELVINKTSTIGGKEIISPAGGVVAHKVEEVTGTYNNVSQKAYRCYFLAEQDGDEVDNDFAVGDQVRSESFNVRKGTYHKAGNHFYWRLVIGRDEDPVELEGKKYHYIDLSDTDCATASDVPAKGDVLNQCGNRTDVERQNCLIFSAVDTYSPSISLYHGINSYSFANREYVEYGVNKQTNKAFFHVYGDMYFGDRPTSANNYEGDSYVKYDSDKKKVTIKGDLDIKSTYDGKTLDKYITEKSLDKNAVETIIKKSQTIIDLQNQIDGAIETWFYDGVPTLSNAPAIGWTTDNDKKTHLGDLYYDNETGKAYRFAKDGSTYKWIIITDTELTKALKDSSQALKDAAAADKKANGAQATANTKRRIFGSQPVPPYDVNDMWVNATYPNDGSTYKNEILKCSTAKAEGEKFDIADWKLASKYTDDTVAEEAKKAAEKAQAEIKTTQSNLNALGTTVTENKKTFDSYVKDGYLEPSEIAAMAQDSKRLEDAFAAAEKSYNEVKGAEVLKSTKELTDLNTAFTTLSTAKTELVTYLSDISTNYNKADTNGKAAIVSAVGTKFTNFQSAYSAFYDKLGLANAYITSKIYGDLKQNITDLAGYKYLKDALGQTTYVDGGLVMTTLLALRDGDGNVQSGINGAIDKNRGKKSIATWWGGQMVDKDYNSGNLTPATSLIRFDGSGYLANGAIWWDVSGKVHADPTSFIISEKNLGAYLTFFEPTWKEGSAGTSVADLVSLKPNAPFSKLGVSGDATFEGAISFHGIKLTYDSKNKAIKIDGNLYTTGGITAYGAGASTTGGGGLNASVISYARILEGSYTDADLTSIPNAYAIKALSSRIDNIATELGGLSLSWNNITGKPSTFTPSAHTHKWTEITDRITKVSQLTNDKGYLTAHQSLASYYTKAEIDAKGYTTNKGTVTSVALTLPTGLTCATKTITTSGTFAISLASGYSIPTTAKQTAWDGAVSAKHTHSNKSVLDGITSTKVTRWDSAYDWYALITTDEETADGVINKWNEVVSFLANIAQTDTLSGIVDGINKSISDEVTRAKKAEGVNASGISTNKTSITTLQGYFTSGSAKKALQLTNTRKLWGNSFNGTADINGSIIVPDGKYISIGNIKMEYDATNKALKITNTTTNEVANLYTSGGVSAYGVGTSSSSGGGLNGSVKSYSNALKLTSESLSEIASAYSIKALDSRISSLEGGSATAISVSGSGNAVTSVTKNGTTISVVKGSTFLTNHQSLDGYVNAISVSGSGNAITSVSKSGKGITFTKGATFLTSHQSLANYYTKSSVDSLLSGKSATSHTHSVKINGVTKTIAASGGTAVDLGTYLTSHQSLADYAKKSEIPTKVSQLTNDTGYITSSGSCAYATNADKVDGVHVTWAGELTSTNHLVAWEADGSALRDIKPANVTVGNSDKLDGIHANGLLTALSNSDKGISITVGGTTKSVSNISVNYASSAGNADTVDGVHVNQLCRIYTFNVHNHIIKVGTLTSGQYGHVCKLRFNSGIGYNASNQDKAMTVVIRASNGSANSNGFYFEAHSESYRAGAFTTFYLHQTSKTQCELYMAAFNYSGQSTYEISFSTGDLWTNEMSVQSALPTSNIFTLPNYQIAYNDYNVASATKLHTPRTIWGQSFDGTGNVNGTLSEVGNIHFKVDNSYDIGSNDAASRYIYTHWLGARSGRKLELGANDSGFGKGLCLDTNLNVGIGTNSPAYKLHVVGDIYSTASIRTILKDKAIILSDSDDPAWISALAGQIIFDTGKAIRFGETAWDLNQWAGLKYTHSNKTIYLGIADNSVFTANSAQSNGTLKFPGITTITPDAAARIGGSGGDLYLGNGNNTNWVKVQNMCSQVGSSYWNITQFGSATFKSLTVNDVISCDSISVSKNAVIAGNLSVNGLINNKGILPTNYEVNNKGAGCYVSADALCSGITAITDSIPVTNVDIHYSNDNGTNWTRYEMSDNNKFKLYANVPEHYSINLGNNVITGNNDAEKLAQVKKNQSMFTFEVLNGCYSQIYFASVDMSNGISTICTVEFIDSKGVVTNTFTKLMTGWNQFNYINLSNGNEGFPVGNNNRRYIRFKFKHDQNTTALRNASINRIRIFAFTKYSFPTDRFMGHTGHIYNFDYNMNTYFPNSILAKGGVTAYQSSDIRLKQDLRKLDYLGIIKAMGGTYGFAWKKDNTRSIGWIAQHVLHNPHLKDIVETDEKGYYKINYWSPKLIATAFGAIEQVGDEVSRLKARVVFLESEVQRLSGDKEDCNKKRLDNKNINSLN
jgi:hypothetical protein